MGAPAPQCPRCGYDQSGEIAGWERATPGSCPLEGLCTECGLIFAWRDVLRPDLNRIPWLFEHARGPGLRAAFATWARALGVHPFWSSVPLAAPVSGRRLILWLLLMILPLEAVLAA